MNLFLNKKLLKTEEKTYVVFDSVVLPHQTNYMVYRAFNCYLFVVYWGGPIKISIANPQYVPPETVDITDAKYEMFDDWLKENSSDMNMSMYSGAEMLEKLESVWNAARTKK